MTKNKTSGFLLLIFVALFGPRADASITETFNFTVSSGVIPDGNASGFADIRTISSSIPAIQSVSLSLNISGGFNGDLYAYVRHNDGVSTGFSVLLNRVGKTSNNPNLP